VIRYTTDSTEPSWVHGVVYSSPIAIDRSMTAIAVVSKTGWSDSQTVRRTYAMRVATTTPSAAGGTCETDQTKSLSTTTPGASK
jgi:hypothetical protein